MSDSEFTHCRMSVCTRHIPAVPINTKASRPALPLIEPTTLLGADTPRQHVNPKPII
jgi:hypothetical protein